MNFEDKHENLENDLFAQALLDWMDSQTSPENYKAVVVNENVLKHMCFEEVFIQDNTKYCSSYPKRYFKNMVPDVAICKCESCNKFFIQDEYEFAYMEQGHCPFCRNVEKEKGQKQVFGSLADMRM